MMNRARITAVSSLLCLTVGVGTTALPRPADARVVEKIVAVVGDDIILQSEMEEAAAPYLAELNEIQDPAQRQTRVAAIKKQTLDALVDDHLIRQQADEMKLDVTTEETDRAVEMLKQQRHFTDAELVEQLRLSGMTTAQHRQMLKAQLRRQKVLDIAVRSRITLSEADVQNYYEKNYKKGAANVEVQAAHIFVAIPDGADAAAAREREAAARKILARAKGGEDFAKLAKEASDDAATRKEGGSLGWFSRDMGLPRAVEDLLFSLKPGDVGGPARGDRGFHIMKVVDRREKPVKPLAEVREEIRSQLYFKEYDRQSKVFLTELRKRTLVDLRM